MSREEPEHASAIRPARGWGAELHRWRGCSGVCPGGADVLISYLGSEEVDADEDRTLIESAGRRRPSDITCSALPRKRLPLCLRLPSRSTRVEPRHVPHLLAPGAQSGTSLR
jgi:hypothetical protein